MAHFSEYRGEITFKTEKEADRARKILADCGCIIPSDDGDNFYWLDDSGDYDEEWSTTPSSGSTIILGRAGRENLHHPIDQILEELEIDKEWTYFRHFANSFGISLAEFRNGKEEWLTDEEIEKIIGFPPEEIDHENGDGERGFYTAMDKVWGWLSDA
jgi:hypothetical protein